MITGTYNLTVNPQWINVQQQEVFLECDTTLAPVTINLFEIAELNRFWGVKIIISDANNNAGTNNITVNASGSDTVDDETTNQIVINTNGSSVSFQVASETQWLAVESKAGGATAPYKVYTALLSQSGGDDPYAIITPQPLVIGQTYKINVYNSGDDFTNVGAPSNVLDVFFVATGTTPAVWTNGSELFTNGGAPIVTVLENTIGNIWFTYEGVGNYSIKKTDNWDDEKTWYGLGGLGNPVSFDVYPGNPTLQMESSILYLTTLNNDFSVLVVNQLNKTPIEIRIYN